MEVCFCCCCCCCRVLTKTDYDRFLPKIVWPWVLKFNQPINSPPPTPFSFSVLWHSWRCEYDHAITGANFQHQKQGFLASLVTAVHAVPSTRGVDLTSKQCPHVEPLSRGRSITYPGVDNKRSFHSRYPSTLSLCSDHTERCTMETASWTAIASAWL